MACPVKWPVWIDDEAEELVKNSPANPLPPGSASAVNSNVAKFGGSTMKRFQAIGCSLALLIGAAGAQAQVPSSAHVYVGEQLPAPRASLGQPVALETAAPAGLLSNLGAPLSL